jgi:hypothetical protein
MRLKPLRDLCVLCVSAVNCRAHYSQERIDPIEELAV